MLKRKRLTRHIRRANGMSKKQSNHAKAPICAKFVKEMRRVFGEDQVTVLYVKEGNFELGEPECRSATAKE
jgi:hypothetical protein